LDLVVLFQEHEEVVEMLNAHILNAKVIHDEAKMDWTPLVFPKSRSRVDFVVAFLFYQPRRRSLARMPAWGNP
jgi:hypothetical protein